MRYRADAFGDFRHAGDIDDVERRVGRRLEEEGAGVGLDGRLPLTEVAAIDEGELDAEARTQVLDDVAAGAEHGLGGDDVLAVIEAGQDRCRDRGHPGCRGARVFRTFQQPHAFLEHRHGRIAEAGVLEARIGAQEPRLGLLGAV